MHLLYHVVVASKHYKLQRFTFFLHRFGLSEIINHLLALNESGDAERKSKPFDFLIDNEFVRTTLKQHLQSRNLSTVRFARFLLSRRVVTRHFACCVGGRTGDRIYRSNASA